MKNEQQGRKTVLFTGAHPVDGEAVDGSVLSALPQTALLARG